MPCCRCCVYYSALSPCIAFTYLLRGVDIVTILFVLLHTFWASVLLSAIGLLVATLFAAAAHSGPVVGGAADRTVDRHDHVVDVDGHVHLLRECLGDVGDSDFWIVQATIISLGLSYIVLFLLAAAAQLSFASDNRSTRLRVAMLAQQILFMSAG